MQRDGGEGERERGREGGREREREREGEREREREDCVKEKMSACFVKVSDEREHLCV